MRPLSILILLLLISCKGPELLSKEELREKRTHELRLNQATNIWEFTPSIKDSSEVYVIDVLEWNLDTFLFDGNDFPNLQILSFSGGRYFLPAGLSEFPKLEIVSCQKDHIGEGEITGIGIINTALPPDLFESSSLGHLKLSGIYFDNLDQVPKMKSLEILDLTNVVFLDPFFIKKLPFEVIDYRIGNSEFRCDSKKLNGKKKINCRTKSKSPLYSKSAEIEGYFNNGYYDSTWTWKFSSTNTPEAIQHYDSSGPVGIWQWCEGAPQYLLHLENGQKLFLQNEGYTPLIWKSEVDRYIWKYEDQEKLSDQIVEEVRKISGHKTNCTKNIDLFLEEDVHTLIFDPATSDWKFDKRIIDSSEIYSLRVKDWGIDTFPFDSTHFPNLQAIYFYGDQYILPYGLSKFPKLRTLTSNNSGDAFKEKGIGIKNTELPPDIFEIRNLRYLSLAGIYFENLHQILKVRTLEELILSEATFVDPMLIKDLPFKITGGNIPYLSDLKFSCTSKQNKENREVRCKLTSKNHKLFKIAEIHGFYKDQKYDSTWTYQFDSNPKERYDFTWKVIQHYESSNPVGVWQWCSKGSSPFHKEGLKYLIHLKNGQKVFLQEKDHSLEIWQTKGGKYERINVLGQETMEEIVLELEKISGPKTMCTKNIISYFNLLND